MLQSLHMMGTALLHGLLVLLLIATNAFFVASEFSIVSLRETRLEALLLAGRAAARSVKRLHGNMDEVLSSVQLGVTLTSLALGWLGEPAFADLFQRAFDGLPYYNVFSHAAALVLAFALITYLHIVLGEIVPKTLSLQRAESIALTIAPPMEFFISICRPLLRFISRSAGAVLRGLGAGPYREGGVHSAEELKLLVTASRRVGLLPRSQEDIIIRALEMNRISVREIMVPRTDIFALPADMPLAEAAAKIVEMQHSRVPVYETEKGTENIIGVLYSKDISRYLHARVNSFTAPPMTSSLTVRSVMKEVLVVPETQPVSELLAELQRRKRHIAVVVDEFGTTAGLVTAEDALEQIVGELEDEFDVAEAPTIRLTGGAVVLDGSVNIRDLETQGLLHLPRDQGFETLAGYVLNRLGHIPHPGETFSHDGKRFSVISMDGLRIDKVKVERINSLPTAH